MYNFFYKVLIFYYYLYIDLILNMNKLVVFKNDLKWDNIGLVILFFSFDIFFGELVFFFLKNFFWGYCVRVYIFWF